MNSIFFWKPHKKLNVPSPYLHQSHLSVPPRINTVAECKCRKELSNVLFLTDEARAA